MPISPGENVGPYRVIEQLGSGGMATVFKAYHPGLDRYVAIKVLHPAFKADPQFFERFQREARIVARLEHPHIIPVYDFNEHGGEPYLVMRFVAGDTLKSLMPDQPMASAEVLRLIRPVCQALAYAHRQGVLHRDIKPSNIMVAEDGTVFLTDFGLARMVQAGESTLSQDMMVGTPQYISPEQAQGVSNLDGRTDIYSLGVVLFEMLTGRVPYSADTPFATIHDHIYSPLPLPSSINPSIDPGVERLLLKTLAKEPADRFASADELIAALEPALAVPARPAPAKIKKLAPAKGQAAASPQPKKNLPGWLYWASAAGLVICLLACLLISLSRRPNPTQPLPASQQTGNQVVDNSSAGNQPAPAPTGEVAPATPAGEPASPAALLARQAEQAMQQQQFAQAVDLYSQAISADPHYLPAYFGLSQAQRQTGDSAGSIATLKQATDQNPDNPAAFVRLGEAYLTARQPEAALAAFEQASHLAPDMAGAYARQAIALLELQRDAEAKTAIDTALGLDQLNPEAHLANAAYLFKQGQRRQARQELELVLRDRRAPQFVADRAREMLNRLSK